MISGCRNFEFHIIIVGAFDLRGGGGVLCRMSHLKKMAMSHVSVTKNLPCPCRFKGISMSHVYVLGFLSSR